ncbi:MAG: hypothetical protein LBJ62_02455 [Bifidobacteriaceae bacterium]|nr:hypothetical protein [Bifidobacteriaceae bacterium]
MAFDPERSGNRKIDDDQIAKAQQRAKQQREEEIKRRMAEAAIKATQKK